MDAWLLAAAATVLMAALGTWQSGAPGGAGLWLPGGRPSAPWPLLHSGPAAGPGTPSVWNGLLGPCARTGRWLANGGDQSGALAPTIILLIVVAVLGVIGLVGGLFWRRRRRARARRALWARYVQLVNAERQLEAEPATRARARALQHIAREMSEIERQYLGGDRAKF